MKALIVGSGHVDHDQLQQLLEEKPFVLCADGGAKYVKKIGGHCDLLLGDFDSITQEDLEYFKHQNTEIRTYPPEKDETDAEIAIRLAKEAGADEIDFIGGIGTRFDHSMANAMLVVKAVEKGLILRLHDKKNTVMALSTMEIAKTHKYLSIIALTDCVVSLEGVKYPLDKAVIAHGSTLGISNEITKDCAKIILHSGRGLLITSYD